MEKILKEPLESFTIYSKDEMIYKIIRETQRKQLEVLKQKELDYKKLENTYCNI